MASIQVFKVIVLVSLIGVAGCVKLPNFPTFFSHQDLRSQEREINKHFNQGDYKWKASQSLNQSQDHGPNRLTKIRLEIICLVY